LTHCKNHKLVFNIVNIFLSILIIFLSRAFLPSTDEADYPDRINTVLNGDHPFFGYYQFLRSILIDLDWTQDSLDLNTYAARFLFTLAIFSPIYLYILICKGCNSKKNNLWHDKKFVFILTILFPGIWFHLGLFSVESYTLMLFLLIIFINNRVLKVSIFIAASIIDIGNSAIFMLFNILYLSIRIATENFGKKYTIILLIIFLLICNIISMDLLHLIEWLPIIGKKAYFIANQYEDIYHINDKYPLILRPIIALMSMIFMLPISHLMAWPLYPVCLYFLFKIGCGIFSNKVNLEISSSFLAALVLVFAVPMILPGFSNGKYYIFVIPYILNIGTYHYKKINIYYFIMICNAVVFLVLILNYFIRNN
jgi:hypothetical protein